ncbi:fused MFS/spermidine synthase [Granulicella tundricola]|uniref:Integral membrane protein-like protein n=1 Tax=Granulicella tundricola (strain ATCC BAA-1859 / DSM 23138 / MP5ACTX9) TaxID=1198114 RepID=E8WXF5_GRATM|nr:fused MFS/spermidine synthase [Granulicella tundricola]ADW67488.1 integral membrane protein-like protein [Granulicella tundricola MP5ACTX9]
MTSNRLLYGVTIFTSAFLLFLVEPMAAKALLPILGGSSAVWITCLVFFQTMLLAGYLYAHWLSRGGPRHRLAHLILLAAAIVALALATHITPSGSSAHPILTIFRTLTITIGLPFLLLASTSPLLQVWLSRRESSTVPYRLFALSNLGSLLGLLAYPILIEPHLTLRAQHALWTAAFTLFAILSTLITTRSQSPTSTPIQSPTYIPTTPRTRLLWFLLPMTAAVQLAAVTAHLTSNVAAIPLLWMLPLAAYLLSFILAFETPRLYQRSIILRVLVIMIASLAWLLTKTDVSLPIGIAIPFFLIELFLAAFFAHAEAHKIRPSTPQESTLFYLLVAAGGVAGTFFVGILSPLLFRSNYDLALAFLLTSALAAYITWREAPAYRILWSAATLGMIALIVALHIAYARQALFQGRNFYGTLRVLRESSPAGPVRMLMNGTIQHGTQILDRPDLETTPTTYYAEDSGAGLAIRSIPTDHPRNIGVIGLGVGTLAAYGTPAYGGRPGDHIHFYEINPLVKPIASYWFWYMRNTQAQVAITEGDGRASLHAAPPQHFDVLVIDAFSGDAIPLHLLTIEAMQEYRRHLAPGGVLAFHVSNQYLNLAPEIAALAQAVNMTPRRIESPAQPQRGEYLATWVLAADTPTYFDQPLLATHTTPIATTLKPWTDDYSALLPVVEWGYR